MSKGSSRIILALSVFLGFIPSLVQAKSPAKAEWTVMVYMAADNNLALQGLIDLEEMELSGGSSSKVKFVVQAEFSKSHLAQYGFKTPQTFGRSSYNTFRYRVVGSKRGEAGPAGAVTDIGKRNMSSPGELRKFITWAKKTHPAKRYALVLWNHGGGVQGLLQDETNAGSNLMSLQELRSALKGAGKVQVLDFDMCLMGGYETLNAVTGLASYVVASQEVVPGAGNPYTPIFKALRAKPGMSPHSLSKLIVEKFHASYRREKSSTTMSAYDMARFKAFDAQLGVLAGQYLAALGDLRAPISNAAALAQSYEIPNFKDISDLFRIVSLGLSGAGATASVLSSMGNLSQQVIAPKFRLVNRVHNGTAYGARDVTNSNGLSITLPSLSGGDVFGEYGPSSLPYYLSQMPGKPWASFVSAFVSGTATQQTVDLGENRPDWYLVWSPGAASNAAEVDLVVMEPSGNLYLPYIGTVTPNGVFTPDSSDSGEPFEGYSFKRFIDPGTYRLLGMLYADPSDYRPLVDVAYRSNPAAEFQSLYAPNYRTLSLDYSFQDDPTFTETELLANQYTDLQYLSYWCFGSGCSSASSAAAMSMPSISKQQVIRLKKLAKEAREKKAALTRLVPLGQVQALSVDTRTPGNSYFRELLN